ncbi:MAG TPA: nucleotidyltransferase domain-containing protein [Candidatus Methanoperedenaceae archaeon]|nr:nucleotidyltransferase domain-containing protein [Candidatus Methanoperedenaceae archaeon]
MEKSFTTGKDTGEIGKIVSGLKKINFIHSVIFFGSRAKGTERAGSDIDLCIIPKPGIGISLKERIALNNSVPENVDISLLNELPVYIRKRVFLEGKVLCTEDLYYVLTLAKETEFEYVKYKRLKSDYHRSVMRRIRARLG